MSLYYTNKLIKEILKNEKAQEMLGWMPPVYGEAYVFLNLLNVLGVHIEEMETWATELKDQVVPQTATWSISYWEEKYGIPVNPTLTLEQRRANVVNQMVTRAPINPKKLEGIISNLSGSSTKIKENTGKNHFTIVCGGFLTPQIRRLVKKEISKAKPAHLIYTIIFDIHFPTVETQYKSNATSTYTKYTIKEG